MPGEKKTQRNRSQKASIFFGKMMMQEYENRTTTDTFLSDFVTQGIKIEYTTGSFEIKKEKSLVMMPVVLINLY